MRKARETADISRKERVKSKEDTKTEQLRQIILEKKKAADANRQAMEQETKRRQSANSQKASEVAQKAKQLKEEGENNKENADAEQQS